MAAPLLSYFPMNIRAFLLGLVALSLTFVVGLSKAYAVSANRCERLFTRALEVEAFIALKPFINARAELNAKKPDFHKWIAETEHAGEVYFERANIRFEKIAEERTFIWDGKVYPNVITNQYRILEGSDIDSNARLIKGFYTETLNDSVGIIIDPFYTLINKDSIGHFELATNSVFISQRGLFDKDTRIDNVLRHEIRHYFESQKIKKNKKSLARFALNGDLIEGVHYSDHASLDELETHIRDLRTLRDLSPDKWDFFLDVPLEATTLERHRSERNATQELKIEVIKRLSKDALASFAEVRKAARYSGFGATLYPNNTFSYNFLLKNSPYSELRVLITGPNPREVTPDQIMPKIIDNIDFAEKRVHEILKEVQKYEK
jgi:hypothetical protein